MWIFKSIKIQIILIIHLFIFITSCAPTLKQIPEISKEAIEAERIKQKKLALFTYLERKKRLYNVWYPLLIGALPFCKKNFQFIYGFRIHNKEMYKNEEDIKILRELFYIDENPTIWYVHPRLPASKVLQVNDKIIKINGKKPKNIEEAIKIIKNSEKLDLLIERNGELLNIKLMPLKGCSYEVYLIFDESINAWAAPKGKIFVTTALMRFIQSDTELALILGHEIAHQALGHITKKMGNVILGSVIDILIAATLGIDTQGAFGKIGGLVYSKEFEREADYIGTYIAARGGYDISNATNLWRRIAIEFPKSMKNNFLATHPSTPERFLLIEKTVQEIKEKKAKGEPLLPSQNFLNSFK